MSKEEETGESLTAASSKTARVEIRIGAQKPAELQSAMMSGKNVHPNLLHTEPALVSSNRQDRDFLLAATAA